MINIIWIVLIFLGIIYSKLNGNNINILESGSTTFDLIIKLLPIMSIWLGLMNIAEKSGLLKKISNLFCTFIICFISLLLIINNVKSFIYTHREYKTEEYNENIYFNDSFMKKYFNKISY